MNQLITAVHLWHARIRQRGLWQERKRLHQEREGINYRLGQNKTEQEQVAQRVRTLESQLSAAQIIAKIQ
jgi:transcription elongation GreA/GreB family factor